MTFRSLLVLLVAVALAWLVQAEAAAQQAITLTPIKDNTLYEDEAGARSNGAGDHLIAGRTAGGLVRRALLAFDVAGAVPAGATIDSVRLSLHMSRTAPTAAAHSVAVHRALVDWGEGTSDAADNEGSGADATAGDATWIHTFFDTDAWQNAGGDFAPDASADRLVDGVGTYSWGPTSALTADVQRWLDAPGENFGWILVGNEAINLTAKRFDSRNHSDAAAHPVLRVFFSLSTGTEEEAPTASFSLGQNYPNPFRQTTTITYELKEGHAVTLAVYDVLGRRVETLVQAWQQAGFHQVSFDARGLPDGVYVYRLSAGGLQQHGTMVVLR